MTTANYWAKAKASDVESFTQHPVGNFHGKIVNIEEDNHNGKALYRLVIKTAEGTVKHTVWELGDDDLQAIGEEKFMKAIARQKRLVVDLGQPEPATHEDWLNALAKIQTNGAECMVVVRPSEKKPGQIVTFINPVEVASQNLAAAGLSKPGASTLGAKGLRTPGY